MFKICIPITKTVKSSNKNVLIVEGIASDPLIDRDEERFSEEAVLTMMKSVNEREIPIKVEHENKFYSTIGVWKSASMVDDKLHVVGEIDLRMSLGRDIEVILEKGAGVALSVGGKVLDAALEFVEELGKSITTYKSFILDEISVVQNPSNYSASLSLAKSFDAKKNQETDEAEKLNQSSASVKVTEKNLEKQISNGAAFIYFNRFAEKTKTAKTVDELSTIIKSDVEDELSKMYYEDEDCCYVMEETHVMHGFSGDDISLICKIVKVLQELDVKQVERPKEFDDWEFLNGLDDECFVLGLCRLFPHHNADFTINVTWLTYWLAQLASGEMYWLSPREYNIALDHLYHHYKAYMLGEYKKTAKSKKESKKMPKEDMGGEKEGMKKEKANVTGIEGEEPFAPEVWAVMKKCYEFYVNKTGARPQMDGNDLSNSDVQRLAGAYRSLVSRKSMTSTIGHKTLSLLTQKESTIQKEGEDANLIPNNSKIMPVIKSAQPTEELKKDEELKKETEKEVEENVEKTEGEEIVETPVVPANSETPVEGDSEEKKEGEPSEEVEKSAEDDKTEAPATPSEPVSPAPEGDAPETKPSEEVEKSAEEPGEGSPEDSTEKVEDKGEAPKEDELTKTVELKFSEEDKSMLTKINGMLEELTKAVPEMVNKAVTDALANLSVEKQFQELTEKVNSLSTTQDEVKKSVSVQKVDPAMTSKIELLEKAAISTLEKVELLGKSIVGRKSLASAREVQKQFEPGYNNEVVKTKQQTLDGLVKEFLDTNPESNWTEAYAHAKKDNGRISIIY